MDEVSPLTSKKQGRKQCRNCSRPLNGTKKVTRCRCGWLNVTKNAPPSGRKFVDCPCGTVLLANLSSTHITCPKCNMTQVVPVKPLSCPNCKNSFTLPSRVIIYNCPFCGYALQTGKPPLVPILLLFIPFGYLLRIIEEKVPLVFVSILLIIYVGTTCDLLSDIAAASVLAIIVNISPEAEPSVTPALPPTSYKLN
eukprot:TRINITY_DN9033_c0_g1_i2.p1 TRINITY_DN9033_c0_g1~~TRINITY_DN9033_c0_g1_i2.p1  ORF type:complete len:196 (-),score=30.04 TRINITY_DN9033_c0_g1_i2:338-925(-)